jgi:hypothetical protein
VLAQDEGLTAPLRTVSQPDGTITSGPASQAGNCQGQVDTKTATTVGRERREYGAFVRRILRAYSRVGDGDVEALVLLVGLVQEIDAAMAEGSRACVLTATPGPRSAHGSASAARPGRPH